MLATASTEAVRAEESGRSAFPADHGLFEQQKGANRRQCRFLTDHRQRNRLCTGVVHAITASVRAMPYHCQRMPSFPFHDDSSPSKLHV